MRNGHRVGHRDRFIADVIDFDAVRSGSNRAGELGAVPAGVMVEPPSAHVVLPGVPTPNPIRMVAGGPAEFTSRSRFPLCVTVKG